MSTHIPGTVLCTLPSLLSPTLCVCFCVCFVAVLVSKTQKDTHSGFWVPDFLRTLLKCFFANSFYSMFLHTEKSEWFSSGPASINCREILFHFFIDCYFRTKQPSTNGRRRNDPKFFLFLRPKNER